MSLIESLETKKNAASKSQKAERKYVTFRFGVMPITKIFEILALAIIQNSKIEGTAVGSCEIKITQYADDTTVFLRNQEISKS